MTCAAGYPKQPCPFGYEGKVTRKDCGTCKHYNPPEHILAWCMLWDRDKELCMKPISACETCPEKFTGQRARETKIDWQDPEAVKKFFRERYNPSEAKEKMLRFLDKHPDYFQRYQESHRAEVNAAALRWYHKNKKVKNAKPEQGSKKVPGDTP